MSYSFYYDETEHSRKINYKTITAENYYDNFITAIVGWQDEKEAEIIERYRAFEEKYSFRKQDGEIKSQTFKLKDFRMGFASVSKNTLTFLEDLLAFYDDNDIIVYISVASKMEYIIRQVLLEYNNLTDASLMSIVYSLVKALLVYKPANVYKAIYETPEKFVEKLRRFLTERIEINKQNASLKSRENDAFEQILLFLDETQSPFTIEWMYFTSFEGFQKLLEEKTIDDFQLRIDREGEHHSTLMAARDIGIVNVDEGDSKEFAGIRMADMLAGIVSRLMHSLSLSLRGDYANGTINKTLIDEGWFALDERQLKLYKRFYNIICYNREWYSSYSGIYADDLIAFITFLQFVNEFRDISFIRGEIKKLPEYYNTAVCESLNEHFKRFDIGIPVELIANDESESFSNQRGAKVYYDSERQPMLPISEGKNVYTVLSAGFDRENNPLVTISEDGKPVCYKLPKPYFEWCSQLVYSSWTGEKILPSAVSFELDNGEYSAKVI